MQDKAPLLTEVSGGTSIVFKNKELYSRRFPQARAEERAGAFTLEPHTLYILASPLLWYGTEVLLNKLPSSSHIIAVELEPQLAALSLRTLEQLGPNISDTPQCTLAFASDHNSEHKDEHVLDSIKGFLQSTTEEIGIEQFRRARLLTLNGGYRLNSRDYSTLLQLLEEEIQQFWQNKYTLMHMLPLFIKNIFRNYAFFTRPEAGLKFGLPSTAKPVLVVGAGPSLGHHISFIRSHRQRFYLIAVDTAYSALLQHEIRPDLVVVQESQFYNLYDFIHHPHIECDILADISSYPRVLQLARSSIYLYAGKFAETALFDRLQDAGLLPLLFPPLGSVGTTAVHAALSITNSKVIVAGIDFAFPAGCTHTRGTPRHQLHLLQTTRFCGPEDMEARTTKGVFPARDAVDVYGNPLRTTPTLRRYADNFARRFQFLDRMLLLQPRGLPLGIPELRQEQLASYFSTHGAGQPGKELPGSEQPGTRQPAADTAENTAQAPAPSSAYTEGERIDTFMREEQELLRSIYARGTAFLQGHLDREAVPGLIEDINSCEYVFLHFPETGRALRQVDATLMKRVLVATGHYIKVIEEARELIPRS